MVNKDGITMNDSIEDKYLYYFRTTTSQKASETYDAFSILYANQKYATCVSLLRIQLDCYIRLLYLFAQTPDRRQTLLEEFYRGDKWKVSDYNMLEGVSRFGWERNINKLGCSFIHLSRLSDMNNTNVLTFVSEEDKQNIISFINQYHNATLTTEASNQDLITYLPKIMEKITDNLLYELSKELTTNITSY